MFQNHNYGKHISKQYVTTLALCALLVSLKAHFPCPLTPAAVKPYLDLNSVLCIVLILAAYSPKYLDFLVPGTCEIKQNSAG